MIRGLTLISILTLGLFAMSATQLQTIDRDTLGCIKGIGEKRLNAIITYREKHQVTSLDELLEISGIGKKTIENIRNDVKKKSCQIDKQKQIKEEIKREKRKVGAE
jgi:competence protein ComEA